MDGKTSLEMGWSGSENLLLDDEVFHELSLLDFRYPESSSINFDLDATYLLDNPSGTTIHSSMDVLPDPTVVHEGGISVGQDGEFGLPDQGMATMNSLAILDQEIPETNFSSLQTYEMNSLNFPSQELSEMSFTSLLTQGMNSLDFPSQELSGMSFSSLLTHGMNSLDFPSQELSGTSFLSFPTQELNSFNFSSQGLSIMDPLSLPNQEPYLNTLELPNQGLSMMDTFGLPTQEAFMNIPEFPNPGLPMSDTLGMPAQESYLNPFEFPNHNLSMMRALSFSAQETTSLNLSNQGIYMGMLEFPHQELSMLDTLSFPAQDLTSIGFPNQETSMNISEFPYRTPPVFMTMEDNIETEEMNTISSSDGEQLQEEIDPNDGNGNGSGGGESNRSLRSTLSLEMISQVFHLSLTNAAKALNVGKTLLKRRCRELNINRWPQRTFKSLQTKSGESSGNNVQETITRLENERKRMEDTPDLQLEDDTIRLRQACYKSSHRKIKQSDRDH